MLNDSERIDHMIEVIDQILQMIDGVTEKEYMDSVEKQYVLKYALIMPGEDAALISDTVRNQFPDIPWRSIRGMRNLIAHDYIKTDDGIVFQTAVGDIVPLREQLAAVKKQCNGPYQVDF